MENSWVQLLAIVGGNLAIVLPLWLCSRAESRSDAREIMSLIKSGYQETEDPIQRLKKLQKKKIDLLEKMCGWEK